MSLELLNMRWVFVEGARQDVGWYESFSHLPGVRCKLSIRHSFDASAGGVVSGGVNFPYYPFKLGKAVSVK
jgi:hypothetical protein